MILFASWRIAHTHGTSADFRIPLRRNFHVLYVYGFIYPITSSNTIRIFLPHILDKPLNFTGSQVRRFEEENIRSRVFPSSRQPVIVG